MKLIFPVVAFVCLRLTLAAAPSASDLNDRYWSGRNEPEVPVLAAPSERGFHGRAAPMVRIGPDNATNAEDRVGRATAWRNERVNLQFVVWTGEPVSGLRVLPDDLTSASGGVIPKSAIDVRFVRNVLGRPADRSKMADHGARVYGDVLDRDLRVDLPRNGYRAFWLTVRTPKDISAGLYKGGFRVAGNGDRSVAFGIELEVVDRTLPDPKDWKFHLNLWQHPNNVAKYHGVAPFSKEHLKLMVPLYRELAEAGQKVITARIEERPWLENGRYRAQVLHRRRADGSFVHDYTIFDLYVSFAQRAGLGPFIACSTIAHRKNNHVFFVDETNGDLVNQPFAVESDESDAFWGAFLKDFERHLREKGWMENAYIDLDELNLKDAEAALGIIRRHAPAFKVEFACDKAPTKFLDFKTEHYSQGLRTPTERMFPPEFWTGLAERGRNPDFVTTFYVCNLPGTPNTWVRSDYDECAWQGLFAAAKGFSGFLRWAAFCWGRDPLWDASCTPKYDAGESFLFYPGMRSSPRWEALRDSFENYEKIRILRETGGMTQDLEAALAAMDLDCVVEQYADEAAFKVGRERVSAQVGPILKALEVATLTCERCAGLVGLDAAPYVWDKVENAKKFEYLNPHFKKAFDFLRREDLATLPVGRYEIDGSNCWAMVQECKLVPLEERPVEAHRAYIDIQAPLSGPEVMGLCRLDGEKRRLPFDEQKDCVLFQAQKQRVEIRPGEFIVFFPPFGGHAPGCSSAGSSDVLRKVVIKVRNCRWKGAPDVRERCPKRDTRRFRRLPLRP